MLLRDYSPTPRPSPERPPCSPSLEVAERSLIYEDSRRIPPGSRRRRPAAARAEETADGDRGEMGKRGGKTAFAQPERSQLVNGYWRFRQRETREFSGLLHLAVGGRIRGAGEKGWYTKCFPIKSLRALEVGFSR